MRWQTLPLGSVGKVRLSARPSTLIGSLLLWALLSGLGAGLLKLPLGVAIVGGFLALVLHWFSDLVHQYGHVWAGRQVGYAATGIQLWWVLSSTLYPADEPALPRAIHLRRAVGGPALSLLLTLVAAVLALLLLPFGGSSGGLRRSSRWRTCSSSP